MKTGKRVISIFCAVVIQFIVCNMIFAAAENYAFETGSMQTPVLLKNTNGQLFIAYSKDGQLMVKKSADNGRTFSAIYPDLKGNTLTDVHDLQLPGQEADICFFTASSSNQEGIFALGLDTSGQPSLVFAQSLIPADIPGSITAYRVYREQGNGFYIAFIKGGSFGIRQIDAGGGLLPVIPAPVPGALDFQIHQKMSNNGLFNYGVYLSQNGPVTGLQVFTIRDRSIQYYPGVTFLETENAGNSLPSSGQGQANRYAILDTGKTGLFLFYLSGGILYTANILDERTTTTRLSAENSHVIDFNLVYANDRIQLLSRVSEQNTIALKAQTFNINPGAGPGLKAVRNRQLNTETVNAAVKLLKIEPDNYLLGFVENSTAAKRLRLYYLPGKPSMHNSWVDISGSARDAVNCEDFSLAALSNGKGVVQYLAGGDNPAQYIYTIDINNLTLTAPSALGIQVPNGNSSLVFSRDLRSVKTIDSTAGMFANDIYLRSLGSETLAVDCISGKTSSLAACDRLIPLPAAENQTGLVTQNGESFNFYSLPVPSLQAPGALWSTGTAGANNQSFCRIYLRDNLEPGYLTLEVQQMGMLVPVTINGNKLGDPADYTRFYHFKRSDTVQIKAEAWREDYRQGSYSQTITLDNLDVLYRQQYNPDLYAKSGAVAGNMSRITAASTSPATRGTGDSGRNGQFTISQIGTTGNKAMQPRLDQNCIAWAQYDEINKETAIYLMENGTTAKVKTAAPGDIDLQLDNREMLWMETITANGQYDIFHRKDGSIKRLTKDYHIDKLPRLDQGNAAWITNGVGAQWNTARINLWDGTTTTTVFSTSSATIEDWLELDGNMLLWSALVYADEQRPFDTYYLYLWDGVQVQILDESIYPYLNLCSLNGGKAVWTSVSMNADGAYSVFTRVWENGVTAAIQENALALNPQIDGSRIVWYGYDNHPDQAIVDFEIYLYQNSAITRITDNEQHDYFPQLSGEQVIWIAANDDIENTLFKIDAWADGAIYPLSDYRTGITAGVIPQLDAGRLVWCDLITGSNEYAVYDCSLDPVGPVVTFIHGAGSGSGLMDWSNSGHVFADIKDAEDGIPSGVDAASLVYKVGDGAWQSSLPETLLLDGIALAREGVTPVAVAVADNAGNQTLENADIRYDITPPVIAAALLDAAGNPAGNGWLSIAGTRVVGSGSDQLSGIANWYYTMDADNWNAISGPIAISVFNQGENHIRLKAVDHAGNAAEVSTLVKWDTVLPRILLPQPAAWINGNLRLKGEDAHAGIAEHSWEYRVGSNGLQSGALVTFTENGTYDLTVRVKDLAGNTQTITGTVNVDITAPVIDLAVLNKEGLLTITAEADDNLSGIDHNSWAYDIDNTGYRAGNQALIQAPGEHIVGFSVSDNAGNQAIITQRVFNDTRGPVITATGCGWNGNDFNTALAAAVDEGGSGIDDTSWYYQLQTADGAWLKIQDATAAGVQVVVRREGETVVYFKVSDLAGNSSVSSTIVRKDTTAPVFIAAVYSRADGSTLPAEEMLNWVNYSSVRVQAGFADTAGSGIAGIYWSLDPDLPPDDWNSANNAVVSGEGVTTLYFQAADNVGLRTRKSIQVKIDRTAPLLEPGVLQSTIVKDSLQWSQLPVGHDALSGIDGSTLEYTFDAGSSGWLPFSGIIDVGTLAAGVHTLLFRQGDLAGNLSQVVTGPVFTIDRTPPQITGLKIWANGLEFAPGAVIPAKSIRLETAASEPVLGYNWQHALLPREVPVFDRYTAGTQEFFISNLAEGENYIYLQAIDPAGNMSAAVTSLYLVVDTTQPGKPEIKGLSHPRADRVEDAVPFKTAGFQIVPAAGGVSAVSHFEYELRQGFSSAQAELLLSGSVPGNEIGFTDLQDNPEGMFYFLLVKTVCVNRLESIQQIYPFRIDSTPPRNLKIYSLSHANPGLYYANPAGSFEWNQPLDFTGVKSFYYKAATGKILPEQNAQAFVPGADWTALRNRTLTLNLTAVTGKSAGQVYLAVCAEDYAGNRQFDEVSLLYDSEKPSRPGSCLITTNKQDRSALVSWPAPVDNVRVNHIETRLAAYDQNTLDYRSGWVTMPPAAGSYVWRNLDPADAAVYALLFKVVDDAGNEQMAVQGFSFSGAPVNIDFSIPFTDWIMGYKVYGEYSDNPVLQKAAVDLPASLQFRSAGQPAATVAFTDLEFSAEDFAAGAAGNIEYEVVLAGYAFRGRGLSLSREQGLVFTELTYSVPVGPGAARELVYTNVGISAPPQVLFTACNANSGAEFAFHSASAPGSNTGWQFDNITTTTFEQKNWCLENAVFNSTPLVPFLRAYTLENAEKVFALAVKNIAVAPAGSVLDGAFSTGFFLEAGGNLFSVHKAMLSGSKIIILEAELVLAPPFFPGNETITLDNFSIDINGQIRGEAGFKINAFSFMYNGYQFTAAQAGFYNNQLVISQGSITTPAGKLELGNLVITGSGLDYNLQVKTGYFEHIYAGFRVASESGILQADRIVFPVSTITMPAAFGSGVQELKDLAVALQDFDTILEPARALADFDIASVYGKALQVKTLLLNQEGLFADSVDIPLPAFIQQPAAIVLNALPLLADGSTGRSIPLGSLDFTIAGFTLKAQDIVFADNALHFSEVAAALPEIFNPAQLAFAGLTCDGNRVITPGTADVNIAFDLDAFWPACWEKAVLDASGIYGKANVLLGAAFDNITVPFENFRLLADGTFQAGNAAAFQLRLKDWLTNAGQVQLVNDTIVIGKADFMLPPGMGAASLTIPGLTLAANGQVLASGMNQDNIILSLANGFRVVSSQAMFKDSGLYCSGKVNFPGLFGSDISAEFGMEIQLDPGGSINIPEQAGPLRISLAGWGIEAYGFSFNQEGLRIKRPQIPLWDTGIKLPIPEIHYDLAGKLLHGIPALENINLDLYGFNLEILEVTLDQELSVEAMVTLPFGSRENRIHFEKLILHPDGSIGCAALVPEFVFNLHGFQFKFENVRFTETGFRIEKGTITLPQGELAGSSFVFTDFLITKDGSFQVSIPAPLKLWGFTFSLSRVAIAGDDFMLEGVVTLPPDFFITELAGLEILINRFVVSLTAGTVRDFTAAIEKEFTFLLYDSWEIRAAGITLEPGKIIIDQGQLHLPLEFGAGSIRLYGIAVDMSDHRFSVERIDLGLLGAIQWGGLSFIMDRLDISPGLGLQFGGYADLDAKFPAGMQGIRLNAALFQMLPGFKVGDIQGTAENINAPCFDNLVNLYNGRLYFKQTASGLFLGCSGELELGTRFPAGLAGQRLDIRQFEIRTGDGALTALDARTGDKRFNLFGSTQVNASEISLVKDAQSGEFYTAIAGNIILPDKAPGALKNLSLVIDELKFNSNGRIIALKAGFSLPGTHQFIGDTHFEDVIVSVQLNADKSDFVFDVAGKLLLGNSFPAGLAGSTLSIAGMQLAGSGEILELDTSLDLEDLTLFDTLKIENPYITLKKTAGDTVLAITGVIRLPESAPRGLAGLAVPVRDFTFNTDGELLSCDIGATGINTRLWNQVELLNGTVSVAGKENSELIFRFTGDLLLPSSLGRELASLQFKIEEFTFSGKHGITAFSAGAGIRIKKELFAGIVAGFDYIRLGEEGIALAGTITLPAGFPNGLADLVISLENLALGWDGKITAIRAGIQFASVTLGGFTVQMHDLRFAADEIRAGACELILPSNTRLAPVRLVDVSFDADGNFHGRFALSKFKIGCAGFELGLYNPKLELDYKRISFDKVELTLPGLIDKGVALYGISISPENGINISGIELTLPSFCIGGGLGFRNVHVTIVYEPATHDYLIAGGGSAIIPGAGTFTAEVSFTNRSHTYPIGLKRAFFSYKIYGMGIPLANTGLFLNEIMGGIAYGPPDEVPAKVRKMFKSDMRLSLGLGVVDKSGGSIVKASVLTWVDINNWTWALQGKVSVFSGLVKGEAIAALSRKVLYGYFGVEFKFIRGSLEIYIFDYKGSTQINGSGKVEFGIKKGSILKVSFFGMKTLYVPSHTIWFGGIGADFGVFDNGKKGFKGYMDLPILGEVGVFVSTSGSFKFGGVGSYDLYNPLEDRAAAPGPAAAGSPSLPGKSILKQPTVKTRGSRVLYMDRMELNKAPDRYAFTVPSNSSAAPVSRSSARITQNAVALDSGLARLIFVVAFEEGNPLVTAISPSGVRYAPGNSMVEMEMIDGGLMMAVIDPEAGTWEVEVDNVLGAGFYAIKVLGNSRKPEITVNTPAFAGEHVQGMVSISGQTVACNNAPTRVALYLAAQQETFAGMPLGEVTAADDGSFRYDIDTRQLSDGEYFVYAAIIEAGDNPEVKGFAPGSFIVDNSSVPLQAPGDLVVAANALVEPGDRETWELDIHFTDSNGDRARGFYLYIDNTTAGANEKIDMGYLTAMKIPGFNTGDILALRVSAYDYKLIESAPCAELTLTCGQAKDEKNAVTELSYNNRVELQVGKPFAGDIGVFAGNAGNTGTAYDYITAEVTGNIPAGMNVGFADNPLNIASGTAILHYTIWSAENATPGTCQVKIGIFNMGNRALYREAVLDISVSYPEIILSDLSQDEWQQGEAVTLVVSGENFYNGTRVFLDNEELSLEEYTVGTLSVLIPATAAGGSRLIRVIGPGGDEKSLPVNILQPDYEILGLKTKGQAIPGTGSNFYFMLRGINRFTGSVRFYAPVIPPGWVLTPSRFNLAAAETAEVNIRVPENAAAGIQNIDFYTENGDVITLEVEVAAGSVQPAITAYSHYTGFPGEQVVIYGQGFAGTAAVKIAEQEMLIISSSADCLAARLPDAAETGFITVEQAGGTARGPRFYIKHIGFEIYPAVRTLNLQAGESGKIVFNVAGYAPQVALEVNNQWQGITVVQDVFNIVPNGSFQLCISLAQDIANGTYPITITGSCGDTEITCTIDVIVGAAFAFTLETLPPALEEVQYQAAVAAVNGQGVITYTTDDDKLPTGILLTPAGVLQGTPLAAGLYRFEITASDQAGRAIVKEYTIRVETNNWAQDAKDGGNSRYNPVPAPAAGRTAWKSSPFPGCAKIITGKNRIFLQTADAVIGLEKSSGYKVFVYSARVKDWAYCNDNLFLLDDEGNFLCIDPVTGNLQWKRETVEKFTTNGTILLLSEAGRIAEIDSSDGRLINSLDAAFPGGFGYFWQQSELFRINGYTLQKLVLQDPGNAAGYWQDVFTHPEAPVQAAMADAAHIVLYTTNGRLIMLGTPGGSGSGVYPVIASCYTENTAGSMAMGSGKVYITGAAGLECLALPGLTHLYTKPLQAAGTELANAAEKIFIAAGDALSAINGYNGQLIWQETGSCLDLAIAGEELFALSGDGIVSCYNAADNLNPPATQLFVSPPGPDGNLGYYRTTPRVELVGSDPESYAAATGYKYNTPDYNPYNGPVYLADGTYSFLYYSTDNHGYREADKIKTFQVDTQPPRTRLIVNGEQGQAGYYTSRLTIKPESSDEVSGTAAVEYSLNGSDWQNMNPALLLQEQGSYSLRFRGIDYAGNVEAIQEAVFNIDLEAPLVSYNLVYNEGIALVTLNAEDCGSGAALLEYSIDGGSALPYSAQLVITEPGLHPVNFRATDKAGNSTPWETLEIIIDDIRDKELITDLHFPYYLPGREIVKAIYPGDNLFNPGGGIHNRIKNLPACLMGASYIRYHKLDNYYQCRPFVSFTAGLDIDVYLVKHNKAKVNTRGWQLVEKDFPIEPDYYYRGGADIYTRSFRQGEKVVIPAPEGNKCYAANLVFVKPARSNYIHLLAPAATDTLYCLDKVRYKAVLSCGLTGDARWFVRLGTGNWSPFGTGLEGTAALPYAAQTTGMELKLEITLADGTSVSRIQTCTLDNLAGIRLLNPGAGSQLSAGTEVPLEAGLTGIKGEALTDVRWQSSRNCTSWKALSTVNGMFRVPSIPGPFFLKGSLFLAGGYVKEVLFTFTVVHNYTPVDITFGRITAGVYTLGEVFAPRENGMMYGFNFDHTDKVQPFHVIRFNPGVRGCPYSTVESSTICLGANADQAGAFIFGSGQGRFRVEATVIPLNTSQPVYLQLGDKTFTLAGSKEHSTIQRVTTEVMVTGGSITVTGSPGLPVCAVRIQKLEAGEPRINDSIDIDRDTVIYYPGVCAKHGGK